MRIKKMLLIIVMVVAAIVCFFNWGMIKNTVSLLLVPVGAAWDFVAGYFSKNGFYKIVVLVFVIGVLAGLILTISTISINREKGKKHRFENDDYVGGRFKKVSAEEYEEAVQYLEESRLGFLLEDEPEHPASESFRRGSRG